MRISIRFVVTAVPKFSCCPRMCSSPAHFRRSSGKSAENISITAFTETCWLLCCVVLVSFVVVVSVIMLVVSCFFNGRICVNICYVVG